MTCAAAGNSLPSRGRARRGARSLSKNGRSAAKALRSSCLMRLRRVAARFFIPVDLESQPGKCDSVETADKRDRPTPARAHGNINDSAERFRSKERTICRRCTIPGGVWCGSRSMLHLVYKYIKFVYNSKS